MNLQSKQGSHTPAHMHVTARVAGQEEVDVEVGEACRTIQALKEAVVVALPQLRVEGFDVSVGGRALDDEGVVSLEHGACLDVVRDTRGLAVEALRETGREVGEAGLLDAARDGDVGLCTLHLDAGVPIDCRDGGDWTPLHHSCYYGRLSLATLLLDRGSGAIDAKNRDGCTPLHDSCRNGHLSLATLLLDRGSGAIDAKGFYDSTPLHHSCRYGHLSLATLLLDRGSGAIDAKNRDGCTPLHHSCRYGHLSLATLLLDRGSGAIDAKNRDGCTPLHHSCRYGHLSLVTLLLDRGCDVDVEALRGYQEKFGAYPEAILKLLLSRGHDVRPRCLCAQLWSRIRG